MDYTLNESIEEFTLRAARQLRQAVGREITARQVAHHLWRFRTSGKALIECMATDGLGKIETRKPGAKGGRPSTVFVFDDAALGINETVVKEGVSQCQI